MNIPKTGGSLYQTATSADYALAIMCNTNPDKPVYLRDVLSANFREANHSYMLLKLLFFENTKDIPFTTSLFDAETVFVLHQALFSSMVTALGRLMDQNANSASIPKAISIIDEYVPTEDHVDDLWRYNLGNWKYNFETKDVELVEPTDENKSHVTDEFLKRVPVLKQSYEDLKTLYNPVKTWRNKQIAHSDIAHNDGRKSVDGIPPDNLRDCMEAFKSLVQEICGHLYQTSIDTSSTWAENAANQLIDHAYTNQAARIIANYIERHSPTPDQDRKIFSHNYANRWTTAEGLDLFERTIASRDEIRNRILAQNGSVNSTEIDEG